jgi:hypothetical protein
MNITIATAATRMIPTQIQVLLPLSDLDWVLEILPFDCDSIKTRYLQPGN